MHYVSILSVEDQKTPRNVDSNRQSLVRTFLPEVRNNVPQNHGKPSNEPKTMVPQGIAAVVGAIAVLAYIFAPNTYFARDACARLQTALETDVVGQDLATSQFVDAVCAHLRQKNPKKPLVISAHGPPGVGKTLTHTIAGKALYGLDTSNYAYSKKAQCPGQDCPGYKVVYGMDYLRSERASQHALLRARLLGHFQEYKEAFVVIEEFDKLDCETRGMLRQLIQHPQAANVDIGRSVIVLESNLITLHSNKGGGYPLEVWVDEVQRGMASDPEAAHHKLKGLVYEHWGGQKCELPHDTEKITNLVDFYLPYFPLRRQHISTSLEKQVVSRAKETKRVEVRWSPEVINFLLSKVPFDGDFAADGAKDVEVVVTRHLGRLLNDFWGREGNGVKKLFLSFTPSKGGKIRATKLA